MKDYADLELGLHRHSPGRYAIEFRFSHPQSDAEIRLIQEDTSLVQFDFGQLRALELDAAAYGQYIGEQLFATPALKAAFAKARSSAQLLGLPLRLRVFIGPSAPELQFLRWETLRDPTDGAPLLMSEQVLFSRYLSSSDWQPVRLRPQSNLRALVMIANPSNLADYRLAPIDVAAELARVRAALGDIEVVALASQGRANLNTMAEQLRNGCDILYLICHGALIKGEPRLWLEDRAGKAAVVAGSDLVIRLAELDQRPRLVVLVSCQSAGNAEARTSDSEAQKSVGPRLAEAGVPAILAIQGNISMSTAAQFMPVFFTELQRHGQIDRAMAVARGAVRERPDFWMPVLFMRLRSGRFWYVPGFASDQKTFARWPALISSIYNAHCTPILGFGLVDSLLGTSYEIARRWAATFHYPMAPHNRDDLPQVAQFLAVNQAPSFPRQELGHYLREELLRRYGAAMPADIDRTSLPKLIEAASLLRQQRDPNDPHRLLAQMPFPIYITTNLDNVLEVALTAAGRQPRTVLCPWNDYVERSLSNYTDKPTVREPLVYHLFGHIQEPDSLVITEDDYFDYLIGITTNRDLIPEIVRRVLADTALLFLGFQIDDWNFRVFFRSIMNQEGRARRGKYAHVAVQIDPEEGRILEPEGARVYLQTYFQGADMSIYWGRADDFIRELAAQIAKQSASDRGAR